MNTASKIRIEEWRPDAIGAGSLDAEIDMLAEVLREVVLAGASVSFFTPFPMDEARAFWLEKVLPGVRARTRRVLIARMEETDLSSETEKTLTITERGRGDRIIGTVQLELDMPPNQQHRAAVAKLLVHPSARRRGIARELMIALEQIALAEGRTLLTLDTVTGSNAELLYRSLDYTVVGSIPRYARGALTPEPESTTIMYKELL